MKQTNNFKDKIVKIVEENKNEILKDSDLKNEYFKLFKKMAPPDAGHLDFSQMPKDIFNNFDYNLFFKKYNDADVDINIDKYLPNNVNKDKINIVVLVNGFFSNKYSKVISKGLEIRSLNEKVDCEYGDVEKYFLTESEMHENPLTVLNVFLAMDGVYIYVPKNIAVKEPIYLFSVITDQEKDYLFNQRVLCLLDENAEVSVIENKISNSSKNAVICQVNEICLKNNAKLNYYNLSDKTEKNEQKSNILTTLSGYEYTVGRDAVCDVCSIDIAPDFSRSRINFRMDGENSEAAFNSFSFVPNNVVNYRVLIEHLTDNSRSNQKIKAIADNDAKFIFNGKIEIKNGVKNVEGHQNSKVITLSDQAEVICEPQLEIYSDDVICTHGAAIGNPNDDLIFYLQSRGIDEKQSRLMLLDAFANEIFDTIKDNDLRSYMKTISLSK